MANGRGGESPPHPGSHSAAGEGRFTHGCYFIRSKMDIRTINEEYTQIGEDLINTEPKLRYIRNSQATIMYLSSEHEKKENGKIVRGQCEKIPEKYKWAIPCDFTVTVFEPNVERLTDEQIRILIFHELLHVGITVDGNDEIYRVIPHDVEEFRTVIDRYGMDWDDEAG